MSRPADLHTYIHMYIQYSIPYYLHKVVLIILDILTRSLIAKDYEVDPNHKNADMYSVLACMYLSPTEYG